MKLLNPEMSREEMIKRDEALRQIASEVLPSRDPEQIEKWLAVVNEKMIHPADARYNLHKKARKSRSVNLTMNRLSFALKEINHQGRK